MSTPDTTAPDTTAPDATARTTTPGARPAVPAGPLALPRILLGAFLLAALVDLGSLLAGADTGHLIAKPLLLPLLAAHMAVRGAPRLLVAALLLGWGGDVLLMLDPDWAFLAGMGSFAVGHVCYLVLFGRRRTSPALGVLYALLLAGTVAALWSGLPADLRIPVAGYSLLLTATAYRSSSLGAVAGTGGALFLLSDTLIATGIAGLPQLPAPDFWVMLTYIAAQYLLATGGLKAMYGKRRTTS
ncbi:lysoplasmalogenase [Streptomyces filamentosus]|uniref:lysoplasmalogenase n=1 Tax=Streptomyces filamentosus TaxID=67294 RepID=UPI0037D2E82B